VTLAANLAEAREALRRRTYHIALLDMRMPDGDGLTLLSEIRESSPATEVVMLTAFGTIEEAIRAMKLGAFDFLTKPIRLTELETVLERAAQKQRLERSFAALRHQVERLQPPTGFVGESPQVEELLRLVERVAHTDSTVLLRGDSGVGKELIASAIHRQSARAHEPFVVVDCASLHENLLQSELFGHEKGAYTGAVSLKNGLFEVADQGTMFLDEIGELTPTLQVKLLRVLETGVFRRLGGTVDIRVDVRVIAATNRSLESMMSEGAFRDDLYYRLNVFSIPIPPLRERREDIPILIDHFIRSSALTRQREVRISPRAMELLTRYSWPGNVRELKNMIERALILCDEGTLQPEHLPLGLRGATPATATASDDLCTLEEAERRYIRRVLEECGGHRQRTAHVLGISERTLYRKLQELSPTPQL
jgi:DNA-binding NtrC family response regulator